MRYYAAKADQRYTLKKGSTYRNLKNVYIIFLCTFTRTEKRPIRNKYLTINSNGIPNGDETKTLLNLVKLMKNLLVSGDTYFDIAQNRIKETNSDENWRDMIMDYETRLLECEQDYGDSFSKEQLKEFLREN